MSDIKDKIEAMISKAEQANNSADALRYSQAGLNAAHAARLLYDMNKD